MIQPLIFLGIAIYLTLTERDWTALVHFALAMLGSILIRYISIRLKLSKGTVGFLANVLLPAAYF